MDQVEEQEHFSLEKQERPVTIGGERYVLIEIDGKQRDTYLDGLAGRLKYNADGKQAGLKSFAGLQASLVAVALRKLDIAGNKQPVALETIQSWPARVLSKLHTYAKEMNAIGDEDEEKKAKEE